MSTDARPLMVLSSVTDADVGAKHHRSAGGSQLLMFSAVIRGGLAAACRRHAVRGTTVCVLFGCVELMC